MDLTRLSPSTLRFCAIEQPLAHAAGQARPRPSQADSLYPRMPHGSLERIAESLARRPPALLERLAWIRDQLFRVEVPYVTETAASLAGTVPTVEGKRPGLEFGDAGAALHAG